MNRIRIISAPTGPSPLDIREKWIGIELPFRARLELRDDPCLSPDRMFDRLPPRLPIFAVDVNIALGILKVESPETYDWYLENRKDLFESNTVLAIEVSCAEVIGEVA